MNRPAVLVAERLPLRRLAFAGLIVLWAFGLAGPASAQLEVEAWTVDAGGGTSVGGDFEVSGTAGQPDAAMLTAGTFELEAGFWTSVNPAVPVELMFFEVVWLENVPSQPSRSAHCRMSAGSIEEETTPLSVTVKETVAWVQPAVSTFSTTVVEPGVRGIWPRL